MVRVTELYDFAGGFKSAKSAQDFTDRQWSELFGVLFDGDQTIRSQWARQTMEDKKSDSFWVWDGKIVYRLVDPVLVENGETVEVFWFGAGVPADNSDGGLSEFEFSEIAFRWSDPINGFWDEGFVWV